MHRCRLIAVAAALALLATAHAQTNGTWTGATDANWSTAANWTPAQPTNGGSVTYNGSSAANLNPNNNDLLTSLSSIIVGAVPGSAPVSIGGNGFTLASGGIDMSGSSLSQALTIALGSNQTITLGAAQTWKLFVNSTSNLTTTQTLTMSSPITGAVGANLTYGVINNR